MAKQRVKFVAVKTVPTKVKFKTKSGKNVSFRALKTVKTVVRFRAKRR